MTSLARMATAELQELVRKDPSLRAAAWAELKFRNQARQAFEQENGQWGQYRAGNVYDHAAEYAKPWVPPDLSDPKPLPEDA